MGVLLPSFPCSTLLFLPSPFFSALRGSLLPFGFAPVAFGLRSPLLDISSFAFAKLRAIAFLRDFPIFLSLLCLGIFGYFFQ